MSADFADWQDEHALDHRRRLRTGMFVSVATHAVMLGVFAASPPAKLPPLPQSISVELVAAAPAAPSRARAPAPKAAPAPEPAPEAAPPPPIAEAPVQVLPEETPGRIREVKPEPKPKEVAKVKPAETPPPRRRREKAVSYDDAMAALADELGVDETADLLVPAASPDAASDAEPSAAVAQKGVTVSPEQRAWDAAVKQQIARRFVDLARYRGRGLVVRLEVDLAASGAMAGEPRLLSSSGDLDFDRRAISAVILAAPLPAPPVGGPRELRLTSE